MTYPSTVTRTVSDPAYTLTDRDNGDAIYCVNPAGCAVMVPLGLYPYSVAIFGGSSVPPRLKFASGLTHISTPSNLAACNGVGPVVVTYMTATIVAVSGNATL